MELSETDGSDARIVALEKKIRDMEALGTGLVNELLDLRSCIMVMSRAPDECLRRESKRGAIIRGTVSPAPTAPPAPRSAASPYEGSATIRPENTPRQDIPVAPAEPTMVMIMQSDGTMKMEPRRGDRNQTDSSGGYGQARRANLSRATRTN